MPVQLKSLFFVVALVTLWWAGPLVAQQPLELETVATEGDPEQAPEANSELLELSARLDAGIAEVRAIQDKLDSVSPSDLEAMLFRRDERSFGLMQDLDQLARKAAELPEDDPQRIEITRHMAEDFAGVPALLFTRMEEFGTRIAKFKEEAESLGGTQRLALQAYILALEDLRIQSYNAAADLIDSRKALGLPVEDITPGLLAQLFLRAETLVGRLQFTGVAIGDLQDRLALDPTNTEVDAAVKEFSARHAVDLEQLKQVADLLERLGQDNVVYQSTLVQQGSSLSVRDLDTDILGNLLTDSVGGVREYLVDQAPDIAFNLLVFLLIIFAFRFLSRLTRRAVIAACERSGADMSTLLKDVLASVSGGTVMVIGILMALSQIGISLGPMLAGLGVAGFIVGFALQDTLGNFAAGGMILIYRPYDVDDFIEVAGAAGLVKKMSLVSTTITTFDNQTLVVPNSKIWGDVIKNVTAQRIRRVDLEFGIGYGDDIEKAEVVLKDVLANHESVLSKPEAMVKVHTLGDSSVNLIVRPWVKTADYWDVYWDLTREVKLRFDREGISIPFPQRDVHLYQSDA